MTVQGIHISIAGLEQDREYHHLLLPENVSLYQDLQLQASKLYSNVFPVEYWNVMLWNYGQYFSEDIAKDEILRIVAHFVPKVGNHWMDLQIGAPSVAAPRLPGTTKEKIPVSRALSTKLHTSKKSKKLNASGLILESASSVTNVTQAAPSIVPFQTSLGSIQVPSINSASNRPYPALPANVTLERYKDNFTANMLSGVPIGHPFYFPNRDWATFTQWRRKVIAKALLIEGAYGVDAQKPCACCQKYKRTCRVLHPEIRVREAWSSAPLAQGKSVCSSCHGRPRYTPKPELCDAE